MSESSAMCLSFEGRGLSNVLRRCQFQIVMMCDANWFSVCVGLSMIDWFVLFFVQFFFSNNEKGTRALNCDTKIALVLCMALKNLHLSDFRHMAFAFASAVVAFDCNCCSIEMNKMLVIVQQQRPSTWHLHLWLIYKGIEYVGWCFFCFWLFDLCFFFHINKSQNSKEKLILGCFLWWWLVLVFGY